MASPALSVYTLLLFWVLAACCHCGSPTLPSIKHLDSARNVFETTALEQVSHPYTVDVPVLYSTAQLLVGSPLIQVVFGVKATPGSPSVTKLLAQLPPCRAKRPSKGLPPPRPSGPVYAIYSSKAARTALLCRLLAERSMRRRHDFIALLESILSWCVRSRFTPRRS